MNDRSLWVRIGAPALVGVLLLAAWEAWVRYAELPKYILPTPSDVASTIAAQWPALAPAWVVTLKTMLVALAAAVVLGVALAALFASSRVVETTGKDFAVAQHHLRRPLLRRTLPNRARGPDGSRMQSI